MIRILLLFGIVAPMIHAQKPLASFVDRNRVLLVFAPNGKDTLFQQQLATLGQHAQDLKERDLVVLPVLAEQDAAATSKTPIPMALPGLSREERVEVRQKFDVAPGQFTALLIGKDGGEKFRSGQPVTVDKLREIIDAMPMRQQEMRTPARSH